jgi:hypothetical protein
MSVEQCGDKFLDGHTGNLLCRCRFNRDQLSLCSIEKSFAESKKKAPYTLV